MNLSYRLAIVAIIAAGALAPAVAASPSADLAAIGRDYASGRDITPCRFTVTQLQDARRLINGDVATYAAGLGEAIDRELKRWKDRKCTAKKVAAAAGGPLRIVSVQPKGGARTESVTIKNSGRKTINLRGYALRDAGDHTLKFRATKLKRGAKLRVITGCRSGSTRALRRGTRYYLCRSKEIWDDAGDTVELLGRGGGLLSIKTYP